MSAQEPLPPADYLRLPVGVERVPAGASWATCITSTNAVTCWTHFADGRTVYCRRPEHDCGPCERGLSRRWEAYVSAFVVSTRRPVVLCVPAVAFAAVVKNVGEKWRGRLRGRMFLLSRSAADKRAPLAVEPLPDWSGPGTVPAGLAVPAILERMWCLPRGFLDLEPAAAAG